MTSKPFERIVFIELTGETQPMPAGLFSLDIGLGVGTFEYGRRYLKRPNALPLDPINLPLSTATYSTRKNKGIFGVLGDLLPDSWGRYLLAKQLALPFGTLREHELFSHLTTNAVGALSLGETPEQPTTKPDKPVSLAELGTMAELFERAVHEEGELPPELRYLLRQGTSLGGAQPKCPVLIDGVPWIAKFESRKTSVQYPALEYATMSLAAGCGIRIPPIRLEEVGGHRIYLIRRFDRVHSRRLPFLSAMAISNLDLNEIEKGSYLEIARLMRTFVTQPREEHHELFRRVVFNLMVRNEDDHLRNHGFLWNGGWALAPAYDLLPMPALPRVDDNFQLALTLGDFGAEASWRNLLSRVADFSLSPREAWTIIEEVKKGLLNWERTFQRAGVSANDLAAVRWCFEGFPPAPTA